MFSIENAELFASNLNRFLKDTPGKFEDKIRKIVFAVLERIVQLNPVDTGLSQNNWQVDLGRINTDILEANKNENVPIERGKATLATKLKNGGIGEVIFIFNNVHYTVYLEYGTPKMQAFAMVRTALGEVAMAID